MRDPQKAADLKEALYANADVVLHALRIASAQGLRKTVFGSRAQAEFTQRRALAMRRLANIIAKERQDNYGRDFTPNI